MKKIIMSFVLACFVASPAWAEEAYQYEDLLEAFNEIINAQGTQGQYKVSYESADLHKNSAVTYVSIKKPKVSFSYDGATYVMEARTATITPVQGDEYTLTIPNSFWFVYGENYGEDKGGYIDENYHAKIMGKPAIHFIFDGDEITEFKIELPQHIELRINKEMYNYDEKSAMVQAGYEDEPILEEAKSDARRQAESKNRANIKLEIDDAELWEEWQPLVLVKASDLAWFIKHIKWPIYKNWYPNAK